MVQECLDIIERQHIFPEGGISINPGREDALYKFPNSDRAKSVIKDIVGMRKGFVRFGLYIEFSRLTQEEPDDGELCCAS